MWWRPPHPPAPSPWCRRASCAWRTHAAAGRARLVQEGRVCGRAGADLQLLPGQTLGVVGESGSGKSTLAQAILGLLPSQGDLQVNSQAWQQPATRNTPANQALRKRVQVVFQDPFSSLSPRLTVEEIVGEGLLVHEPGIPLPSAAPAWKPPWPRWA